MIMITVKWVDLDNIMAIDHTIATTKLVVMFLASEDPTNWQRHNHACSAHPILNPQFLF